MESSWARRRKTLYGIIFFILGVVVIGVPAFLIFHKPASCSDGTQNGDEEGVDCGGSCTALCQNQQAYPIVLWTRNFQVSPGVYSAVAYIENPNVGAYASNAPYKFTLRDDKGEVIAERSGTVFIPAHKVFAAFEANISTGTTTPGHIEFEFSKPPFWQRTPGGEPELSVVSKVLTNEDDSPRVDATIQNNSIQDIGRTQVMAIVYEGNGNAVAASRTYIDELPQGQSKDIVFTWPNRFNTEVASCDAPVDAVMLLDRSGSMASDGSNPPQPLTDVKNAAQGFVDNLTAQDQAGVISFATTPSPSPDSLLTGELKDVKNAISRIAIHSDSTQYTNIGDALKSAEEELGSSRHRKDAKQEIVLLTDGVPTQPVQSGNANYPRSYALDAASEVKSKGIDLFTIGLGKEIDEPFLTTVASKPEQYYSAPTTATLKNIYKEIAASMCRKSPTVIEIIPLIEH